MDYSADYASPFGNIRLFSDGEYLTGLHTEFWQNRPQKKFVPCTDGSRLGIMELTKHWLHIYFAGNEPDFTPPLKPAGSVFRKEVWEILCGIPYGKTMTYGEIARIIARKHNIRQMSAQAVGGAVGANPVGIIIPCHRVIGTNGNLTGYAGGLMSKVNLLKLEGVDTDRFTLPKKSRFL